MTREEAEDTLERAGQADDDSFPLLEAAIACALHDFPFRDASSVRLLAVRAGARLAERILTESHDDALTETMGADFGLNGDLLDANDPTNTDVIAVASRRRGLSAALSIFYLDAAQRAGVKADGVDFPNHFLLRVETTSGPVALDPFSQGRIVLPSELSSRALLAGLTPHVAHRLDLLMAPVTHRQALIRLQNMLFNRSARSGDYQTAERSALRRALLDPADHKPWLDVASIRERQGRLAGAIEALAKARRLSGDTSDCPPPAIERLRMKLN